MAAIFTSHHFTALAFLLVFFPKTLASDPISSFSFTDFDKDPEFDSTVALYGNAKIVKFIDGSAIQLSGTGRAMYRKPIKLVAGKSRKLVSFSTYFAFSMSLEEDDGLAFVMAYGNDSLSGVSSGLTNRNFLGISFEVSTSRDGNERNGSSVIAKINNSTSSVKIGLKSEQKLHVWIDYEPSSLRLEVRLSQYGNSRPLHPLLWRKPILSTMKEKNSMFVGFSTVKENTSETCFLHSWSFMSKQFPYWIHSEPLDPDALNKKSENLGVKPKCDCFLRAVSAMVFGAAFGGLIAFVVLSFWSMFGNRRPVVPEECVDEEFKNKKVNIVVDKCGMKK